MVDENGVIINRVIKDGMISSLRDSGVILVLHDFLLTPIDFHTQVDPIQSVLLISPAIWKIDHVSCQSQQCSIVT